jgi:hypothetical protein
MSLATRCSVVSLLSTLLVAVVFTANAAAQCLTCSTGSTLAFINFEAFPAGMSVEGLGAVHPSLNITSVPWAFAPSCTAGTAAVIEEGNVVPFASYGTAPGSFANGCLTGTHGYGDQAGCVLDYDFTFAAGVSVTCFSFRMLDYGDLYPFGTGAHQVDVTAYDAGNNVVDTDQLLVFGAVQALAGDACDAGPNDSGNHLFTVTGPGIVKVTLRFDASPDPNVGFDDISFCQRIDATPAAPNSWGMVKTIYR